MIETKPEFPKEFTKCPVCGCEETLSGIVSKEQIEAGKLDPNTRTFIFQTNSVIASGHGRWLSAPAIVSHFDVCADCGTMYCIHTQVVTVMQGQKQPQGKNPFSTS